MMGKQQEERIMSAELDKMKPGPRAMAKIGMIPRANLTNNN